MNEDQMKYWGISYNLGDLVCIRQWRPSQAPLRSMEPFLQSGMVVGFSPNPLFDNLSVRVLCGDEEHIVNYREVHQFKWILEELKGNHDNI